MLSPRRIAWLPACTFGPGRCTVHSRGALSALAFCDYVYIDNPCRLQQFFRRHDHRGPWVMAPGMADRWQQRHRAPPGGGRATAPTSLAMSFALSNRPRRRGTRRGGTAERLEPNSPPEQELRRGRMPGRHAGGMARAARGLALHARNRRGFFRMLFGGRTGAWPSCLFSLPFFTCHGLLANPWSLWPHFLTASRATACPYGFSVVIPSERSESRNLAVVFAVRTGARRDPSTRFARSG